MFGSHFYHRLTQKYVTLFGNMFNNISIVHRNTTTGVELKRIKVPISYGPKEKWFTRLRSDPDLNKATQVTLPVMSYEITGFQYNAAKQQSPLLRTAVANTASRGASQYIGVPYDITFDLELYTRNIDDGNQIIEQILPYFSPDYTVSVSIIPELGLVKDIPIVLNSVSNTIEHEGNFDSVRTVYWNLSFTMKAYYFGPIATPKIIRKAITNLYNFPDIQSGSIVRLNIGQGNNGTFKIEDVVYQGPTYETASAYGIVNEWHANTGKIIIGGAQGSFATNNTIKAVSSNANYNVVSFEVTPQKFATITIEPNPLSANADDDFGYTTTITETIY